MINCLKECCKKKSFKKNQQLWTWVGSARESIPNDSSVDSFPRIERACRFSAPAPPLLRVSKRAALRAHCPDQQLSVHASGQIALLFSPYTKQASFSFSFQHSRDAASCLRKGFNNNNKKKTTKNELAIFFSLSLFLFHRSHIFFPSVARSHFFLGLKKQSRERERDVTVETFPPSSAAAAS